MLSAEEGLVEEDLEGLGRLEVSGEVTVVHHQPLMALQVSAAVTAADTTEDRYSMKQHF
jgi:hypothetical protein